MQENLQIAARLREYAGLLEAQGEDGFRVAAFRTAAHGIETSPEPLRRLFESGGTGALIALRGIGRGIAAAIAELLTTGQWRQLERLKGSLSPEDLFRTIPGIGPELARRLVDTLDVETLEDLETALRLDRTQVPGIGPRRREAILAALEQRLARMRRGAAPCGKGVPPVSLLLDADALYRARAEAGDLRRIAPRRFNPTGEAWLPIMHARRGDWHLTVLFSNTARAHELDRTGDWVVIYFHDTDGPEERCTVVTERRGVLAGKRVVRGREDECLRHYAASPGGDAPADAGAPSGAGGPRH
ncbi:helix-hairpin-helix domain-containing protein [Roseibacterium sp. SDUM158017]|uniref:helix-hairpin-helix domain-containing protein n=1 Tax=Roseicyclus salinarum TaxID=3036773 RepID=UPI0024156DF8|nr:helix-hairpin-helix domain-containing protein [Roseibacterium sp. SDUM158017]MDG4648455.1 helix-hairpin-helix domain-containing protein [Roseibacterium sp. SDUM158017]